MADEQFIPLTCDDSYLSLLLTTEQQPEQQEEFNPIDSLMSDAEYAQELQFQEAIMASILLSTTTTISATATPNLLTRIKKEEEAPVSSQTMCEICAEQKDNHQIFSVPKCRHRYCTDCIAKHVATKVQKSVTGLPTFDCPGLDCQGVLDIESCRPILPKYVLAVWDYAVCEGMIDSSQKFYCPYKDCSALILNDGGEGLIRESECPFCHRLFCVQCKVPWHSGVGCQDFMRLGENERTREDLMVHELARKEKWQRCPRCKFFVEKKEGCLHMTCRCGYQFCYACGKTWTSTHGGCQ